MTGKLIKYEFRSIVKLMGIVWIALPAMAIIMSLFDVFSVKEDALEASGSGFVSDTLNTITSFLYVAIFVALIVVTILIVIMRFYKGLLRDEGYLMHTLPVKTWQLIMAKGVVGVLVELISVVVAAISVMILGMYGGGLKFFWEFLKEIGKAYAEHPEYIGVTIEVLILIIMVFAASNYRIYTALSIGQLASKHRIALSVAAYLGIGVVLMLILSLMGKILNMDSLNWLYDMVGGWTRGMDPAGVASLNLFVLIVSQIILTAVYHVVSNQILKRRLNLE